MELPKSLENLTEEIKEKIFFKDNKIYFPYDSDIFYYLYSILTFIIFIGFTFIIVILLGGLDNDFKSTMAIILPFILLIIFHLLYYEFTTLYRVIDIDKDCIYTEIRFMDSSLFEIDSINIKDINEIGNNCISVELEKKTKKQRITVPNIIDKNENTGFYHRYGVSLLLKSGEIYHLVDLGYSMDDFYNSIELAEAMSKFLKLDLIVCENNNYLKAITSDGHYKFKKEIITKEQIDKEESNRSLIINIIIYAIIILFIIAYNLGTSSGS